MKSLRAFTVISLMSCAASASACWYFERPGTDNMIYRLYEDVTPYYMYQDNHSLVYAADVETEADNLALWRRQTATKMSDGALRWYVYKSSAAELRERGAQAVSIFGRDGYRLLVIAKECEAYRSYLNDPWYYPCRNDRMSQRMEPLLREAASYNGRRYASRYALQALRLMVAKGRYAEAVSYWEKRGRQIPHDAVWDMAERHAACAYLHTGDTLTAASIYARQGDLMSLHHCRLPREKVWNMVYDANPDSPFFKAELQFLLTHIDNRYMQRNEQEYRTYGGDYFLEMLEADRRDVSVALSVANRAIADRRSKNLAMWYYAKAAILDAMGRGDEALATARTGLALCPKGSFLATSMRVLRMYIEAQSCNYDADYIARLGDDLKWLNDNAHRHLTDSVRKRYAYEREQIEGEWYTSTVRFDNQFYWYDVMSRVLVDALVPRLIATGHSADAFLYANLGVFWIMKNVYGRAESPNDPDPYITTTHSNAMVAMADTCRAADLIEAYRHIARPTRTIDRLVRSNGQAGKSYLCDLIGSRLIAEHNYALAAKWLRNVSRVYQRRMPAWKYYTRDPFCFRIGWSTPKRHHTRQSYDYKLRFASEMARLKRIIDTSTNADERGEAMIRYGVGLRNQKEWCWALTRYGDSSANSYGTEPDPDAWGTFYDISDSKQMIEQGIATLKSRELKAHYLHLFARNKEVMDFYADTRTASDLRAHCDLWRDYK